MCKGWWERERGEGSSYPKQQLSLKPQKLTVRWFPEGHLEVSVRQLPPNRSEHKLWVAGAAVVVVTAGALPPPPDDTGLDLGIHWLNEIIILS